MCQKNGKHVDKCASCSGDCCDDTYKCECNGCNKCDERCSNAVEISDGVYDCKNKLACNGECTGCNENAANENAANECEADDASYGIARQDAQNRIKDFVKKLRELESECGVSLYFEPSDDSYHIVGVVDTRCDFYDDDFKDEYGDFDYSKFSDFSQCLYDHDKSDGYSLI